MTEPEGTVDPQTAPALEPALSETTDAPQETSTLTLEDVKALIAQTWSEREDVLRK